MATFSTLAGWDVNARKETEMSEEGVVEVWVLYFQEHRTGNQIRFAMRRDARDELVRQLTSGLVLAGGEFPKP